MLATQKFYSDSLTWKIVLVKHYFLFQMSVFCSIMTDCWRKRLHRKFLLFKVEVFSSEASYAIHWHSFLVAWYINKALCFFWYSRKRMLKRLQKVDMFGNQSRDVQGFHYKTVQIFSRKGLIRICLIHDRKNIIFLILLT